MVVDKKRTMFVLYKKLILMQVLKDNIRLSILKIAKNEFLNKGFKAVSMRHIANETGVSLSNIYNYFKNKDEILKEVLQPLMCAIERLRSEHNKKEHININVFYSDKYMQDHVNLFSELIITYKRELDLLLFKSQGSCYENFKEDFTVRHTEMGYEYMRLMKEKYPSINIKVSDFFIHTMSSAWISIIGEVVAHNISRNEMEEFFKDYVTFTTAGWKKLMQVE